LSAIDIPNLLPDLENFRLPLPNSSYCVDRKGAGYDYELLLPGPVHDFEIIILGSTALIKPFASLNWERMTLAIDYNHNARIHARQLPAKKRHSASHHKDQYPKILLCILD
jgi:hypothetical protein